MQHLNRLVQIASVANDLTRHKQTYTLPARIGGTFYLDADNATVRVVRWDREQVEVTVQTRPPIGWRVATDFDEAGTYMVIKRRSIVGSIARAELYVLVPRQAFLLLRMNGGLVALDHVDGVLHIPPPTSPAPPALPAG